MRYKTFYRDAFYVYGLIIFWDNMMRLLLETNHFSINLFYGKFERFLIMVDLIPIIFLRWQLHYFPVDQSILSKLLIGMVIRFWIR